MTLDNSLPSLPDGWIWTTIGACCQVNHRNAEIQKLPDELPVSFVPMAAVDADLGTIANPVNRFLGEVRRGFTAFGEGDVIFARITPSMENGKAAIALGLTNGLGFGSTEFHVMRPGEAITPKWLFYFIRQNSFREEAKANFSGTAGQLRVPDRFIRNAQIPLPPLTEQERIVAELEALLQQSRTARQALGKIPSRLRAFRRAVLEAAFRGELSERCPDDEPAQALLERIRQERRRKWEESLRSKGKDPANYRYEEPAPPDTSNLPELPEGWVWANLDLLADVRSGVIKGRDLSRFETIEVPYLRVANVQAGYLDLSEIKTIRIKRNELENYRLMPNDILYTEGGDRDKLGRGTVWRGDIDPCIHQNHIFSARLYLPELNSEWISLTSQLEYAHDYTWSVASQSVNLASINSTNLKAMPIPLPSIQEQKRVVERVTQLYAITDSVKAAAHTALRQIDELEQLILVRAFRGKI